ncbi:MAG TPA: redoxin domain-containing protein, partial [Terrimicrobiaceae bacterium]
MKQITILLLISFSISHHLQAGAEEEWAYIISLDAGPTKKPTTRDEAALLAHNHLLFQRKAVEQFLQRYPSDSRAFEAKLRRARILAADGKLANNQSEIDNALRLLADLENSPGVPREKLADAGFARASLSMQNQNENADRTRESIIWSARNFTAKYPGDRRGPRLLVEAATVCDEVPNQKRDLLEEALRATQEEPLKHRIADDLRRLDLLGKPLELKITQLAGGEIDLSKLRGKVVVLIFWSSDSPHSLLWLRDFRSSWEAFSKEQLRVVTVSL